MLFRIFLAVLAIFSVNDNVIAFNLECDIITGGFLAMGIMKYCKAKNLIITKPNQTITSVNGQPASSFVDQNVKGIYVYSQTVNYFPRGSEKFFPDIEGIQIGFSKLKSVDKCDLESLRKLRHLYLHQNDLESLDADLFENNLELEVIYFNSNKLTSVGEFILSKLTKLEQAYFQLNVCINKDVWTKTEIPNLIAELRTKCPKNSQNSELKTCKNGIAVSETE